MNLQPPISYLVGSVVCLAIAVGAFFVGHQSGTDMTGTATVSSFLVAGLFGFLALLSLIGTIHSILLGGKPVPSLWSPELGHKAEKLGQSSGRFFESIMKILAWGLGAFLGLQVLMIYILLFLGTVDLVLYFFGTRLFSGAPDEIPWGGLFSALSICSVAFFAWRESQNKIDPVIGKDWPRPARVLALATRILIFALMTVAVLIAFGFIGLVIVSQGA